MKRLILATLAALLLATPAWSADYDIGFDPTTITQPLFDDFVKEVGTLIAYRALAPAEPQGVTGFDVGIAASAVKIDDALWNQILTSTDFNGEDYLLVPSLRARKGLAFGLDVGASYAWVPSSNVEVIGAELQWALLEGSVATPALSLRGSWSSLNGVNELDVTTYGADAVLSKGIAMFTPYAGIGVIAIDGKYKGPDPGFTVKDVDETLTRYFGGVQMALALLRVTADVEYLEQPVYSLKLSLGW